MTRRKLRANSCSYDLETDKINWSMDGALQTVLCIHTLCTYMWHKHVMFVSIPVYVVLVLRAMRAIHFPLTLPLFN